VLISVVIPTRNRPELLLRAVSSVLEQTHRELEVLVVIDGPCARSSTALARLTDPRVRPIVLPASVGGSDARNTGVRHAAGEWIAFLDDDDEWLPTKLAKQAAVAKEAKEEYPIISTGMVAISPGGKFPWPRRYPADGEPICEYLFNRRSLFKGEGQIQTSVLLTRKALLEREPFTSGLRRHQDTEWYLRVDQVPGVKFHFVREPLVLWYIEQPRESITNGQDWRKSLEWLRGNRARMTPRAYAGFICTQLAAEASMQGAWRAAPELFSEMFRNGKPGAMEVSLFAAMWVIRSSFRRKLRGLFHPKGQTVESTTDSSGTWRPLNSNLQEAQQKSMYPQPKNDAWAESSGDQDDAGGLRLSSEQTTFFQENGYLPIHQIATPEEVRELRAGIEDLFARRVGEKEGAQEDFLAGEKNGVKRTAPQIMNPVNYRPELHRTQCFKNALAIARQILGENARCTCDLAILKQAQVGTGTPWHQDEAFRDPSLEYHEMNIWVALQDATAENGCLRYLPGSHRNEVLQHGPPNNDETSQALECVAPFDKGNVVTCELPAGGCTIHHSRMLHSAGPNVSTGSRLAYVMIFGIPPTPARQAREFPWLKHRDTVAQAQRRRWIWRGGLFIAGWRKLKREGFTSWKAATQSVGRSLRNLR
jgi:glycosyltransferase involved in cell wall biosynthesis/ectoine hydroxylase-related dioxygenase (phytanoyl-CoA dioxygenase family)